VTFNVVLTFFEALCVFVSGFFWVRFFDEIWCELQNVDKLEKVVKDGNYYGAQQMYKSLSARFKQFLALIYHQAYDMCFILQHKCILFIFNVKILKL
jgi:hypothetical protein